jgi:hypothetical protein
VACDSTAFDPPGNSQPLSVAQEATTMRGSSKNVTRPSQISITLGELTSTIMTIQTYANKEQAAVRKNTGFASIFRVSGVGMVEMQTATIMSKLKAAEPKMVEGPMSPLKFSFFSVSTTDSKISGAEDPNAIRVRLETVSFQIFTVFVFPLTVVTITQAVMVSIAAIKASATTDTPTKK